MGRRRKSGRDVHGVMVIHKPQGLTSNQALQKVRYALNANRAGHTGALDPLATGVLPLCFGEATKFSQYLLDADKAYRSTFRLGVNTSTLDTEGEVLSQQDASHITEQAIKDAIAQFVGPIEQVPPMVSALKHQGQPLYKLAREGKEVERKPRPITIYAIDVLAIRLGAVAEVDVHVKCSKGTYIRSLAQDVGDALGVGGHVAVLHRTAAGAFDESHMHTLDDLFAKRELGGEATLDGLLLPVDACLGDMPRVVISTQLSERFLQGQSVKPTEVYSHIEQGDKVRVCSEDGQFFGVGELQDGTLAPKRLVVLPPSQ